MSRAFEKPNAWLTGAGARSAEGSDIGHENGEAMAYVGVRVEPPVRLVSVGKMAHYKFATKHGAPNPQFPKYLYSAREL